MAGIAKVGDTPSLTGESIEKCTRDKQVSCTAPSLAPLPQAGLPHPGEYLRPLPLTTYQLWQDKEI